MSDFDDKARQWDQNQMHLDRTKAVAAAMLENIPVTNTMKALEFGAGTGLLSFYLKDRFKQITLMDTSLEMLKMAEEKLEAGDEGKIKTIFFNLENEPYTGEPFDIIYSQMVLHHIKDVPAILDKFSGMLLPGGFLAIADLYPEDGSFHDPGVEVHHGFDPAWLSELLSSSGFIKVSYEKCFTIHRTKTDGTSQDFPIFLLAAAR